jgi:hypothetical protein
VELMADSVRQWSPFVFDTGSLILYKLKWVYLTKTSSVDEM